jgi:hypothetical protein
MALPTTGGQDSDGNAIEVQHDPIQLELVDPDGDMIVGLTVKLAPKEGGLELAFTGGPGKGSSQWPHAVAHCNGRQFVEALYGLTRQGKCTAKEVGVITVTDPDTALSVDVQLFKESGGGMGGVDASYLEQEVGPVISPHGNGEITWEDDDG